MNSNAAPIATPRAALRQRLLQERQQFALSPAAAAAEKHLAQHLISVLRALEPQCLGLYWPIQGEFNAPTACRADSGLKLLSLALPFAQRQPPAMHYRAWDGHEPTTRDDCGVPAAAGARCEPDVVVVPCVGFTRSGFRLGYGGGFFDRWLAAHPGVTSIGVGWQGGLLGDDVFGAQAHDLPLTLIVTEHGVLD